LQPARAAFAPSEESKVVGSQSLMSNSRQIARSFAFVLLLPLLFAASGSLAFAQFTLTIPSGLQPPAVDPGETSIATIDLAGSSNSVSLSCAVTSNQTTGTPPSCAVSPSSLTPPGSASLTITTSGATVTGSYPVTVTGVSGANTQSVTLNLGVTNLSEDYTLSVTPTTAVPSPIHAGSSATTTVSVSPIGSYTGSVTLACLTVTPTTTLSPVCTFNPPTVAVTSGTVPPTSTLTLSTTGPAPTVRRWGTRIFYAIWLAVPGLALAGWRSKGRRRNGALAALLLLVIGGGVLMLPACNSASKLGTNGDTPANTYTFTLSGADQNGAGPSNTTTNEATVSIAVTNP